LSGLTLGTGFGNGVVRNGKLLVGDDFLAGEIWLVRNKLSPILNIENHVCIKAIRRKYSKLANADIYKIAKDELEGGREAAISTIKEMVIVAGDAISNVITIIDGLIVIGGGLSGASDLFIPYLVDETNGNFRNDDDSEFRRLVQ
jgi:glucokinase